MLAFTSSLTPTTLTKSTSSKYKPLLNLNKYPKNLKPNKNPTRLVPCAKKPDETETKTDENEVKKNGRPRLNLKWVDLVFDPDPDNVVAVGLTGVLAWASVQVLWQLFCISLAILVAALKYSFIAALLVFILITLL